MSGWSMCGSAIQEVVNTGEVVNEEHQATIRPRESVGQRAGRMNTVRDNAEHRITNDAILRKSVANASGVPVQSKLMVQQSYHPMNNPSLPPLPPPPFPPSLPSSLPPGSSPAQRQRPALTGGPPAGRAIRQGGDVTHGQRRRAVRQAFGQSQTEDGAGEREGRKAGRMSGRTVCGSAERSATVKGNHCGSTSWCAGVLLCS